MPESLPCQPQDQCPTRYRWGNDPPEFVVFTDGAGYQDGYGGSAAIVASARHGKMFHRVLAATGTSVDRSEFVALLIGLRAILDEMCWTSDVRLKAMSVIPVKVLWYSDRESLVKSVNGEYGRKAQPDLWHLFAWYERYFQVHAVHVPRKTNSLQDVTDRMASEARIVIKDFDQLNQELQII